MKKIKNLCLLSAALIGTSGIVPAVSQAVQPVTAEAASNSTYTVSSGQSLADTLKKAKSGDTVVIKGTVKSKEVSVPAGVTIKGENKNAKVDFYGSSKGKAGFTVKGNNTTIKDLKIVSAADNGIYVTGNNNKFENLEVSYCTDTGVQLSNGASNNYLYNIYSHHNADRGNGGENADGFAIKLHSGTGNVLEKCVAEYNSDDGYDCYAAHGAVTFKNCQANYNGNCDGIKGDGNGFKLGGVDNKTKGQKAHLDPLDHYLENCTAKGNTGSGFDRNNQNGVVTMKNCVAESNGKANYNWPLKGKPSALGYEVTFGKAKIVDCVSKNGKNNIAGATLSGNCIGFSGNNSNVSIPGNAGSNASTSSSSSNNNNSSSNTGNNNSGSSSSNVGVNVEGLDGVYYLKNAATGKYLDVANGNGADGTNIQQWSYNGCDAQKFKLVSDGQGYYTLYTGASNYKSCVDVSGWGKADGTNIQQWSSNGGDCQKFKIVKENGKYAIKTKITGCKSSLDVSGSNSKDGTNVLQWNYKGANNQGWYLEKADSSNSNNNNWNQSNNNNLNYDNQWGNSDPAQQTYTSLFWGNSSASNWNQAVSVMTTKNNGGTFDASKVTKGGCFYVEYEGNEVPELILQSWSGANEWAKVSPSETGYANGRKYAKYSYDNCKAAFGTSNFKSKLDQVHVSAQGSNLTVYSVCYNN